MNENILLECRKVVMGYDGAAVVNSVSFELERGDYLCIVGENGSGNQSGNNGHDDSDSLF